MTSNELIRAFQTEIHQKDRPPQVETKDILYFLNRAQENFIKDKFAGKRTSTQGFEESQDLIDDLRVFYRQDCETETIYAGESAGVEGVESDETFLPSDYLHLVSARAGLHVSTDFKNGRREDFTWETTRATYEGTDYSKRIAAPSQSYDEKTVPLKMTQGQRLYSMATDPFHEPVHHRPLFDLNNDRINVYTTSEFIVDRIIINYIRSPKTITIEGTGQTSELPDDLHRELVNRAVRLFLQKRPQRSPSDE